jgi:hypothetical protein
LLCFMWRLENSSSVEVHSLQQCKSLRFSAVPPKACRPATMQKGLRGERLFLAMARRAILRGLALAMRRKRSHDRAERRERKAGRRLPTVVQQQSVMPTARRGGVESKWSVDAGVTLSDKFFLERSHHLKSNELRSSVYYSSHSRI